MDVAEHSEERGAGEAPPGAEGAAPDRRRERAERLARALRENLRRRKEQARARRASGSEPPATPGLRTGDG